MIECAFDCEREPSIGVVTNAPRSWEWRAMEEVAVSDERVTPFSNGTQSCDWDSRNCARCKKVAPDLSWSKCDICDALTVAYIDDVTVSAEIGRRMGYVKSSPPAYTWDCPEREVKP